MQFMNHDFNLLREKVAVEEFCLTLLFSIVFEWFSNMNSLVKFMPKRLNWI